jgi:hypothetical protein
MNGDSRISAQEAKVSSLRRKEEEVRRERELEDAVLRGMRLMVSGDQPFSSDAVLPDSIEIGVDTLVAPRRGRQPGAISREWRNTLQSLYQSAPVPFTSTDVYTMAHVNGLPNVGLREAENRIRAYLDLGYLNRAGSGYQVSDLVVKKYGFSRPETTEAPTADAGGAS